MEQIHQGQERVMWQTLGKKVIKPLGSIKFGESDKGNLASQEDLCSMEFVGQ